MSSEANEADPAKDDTQKLTERLETLGATNHHLPMENANTIPRSNIHRSVPSVSDIFGPSVLQRASSSEQATATQEAPEETARARHFDDGSAGVSYERVDFANPSRSNNDFYTNARASTRTPEHPPLENSVTQSNSLSSNEVDPGSSTRLSVPNIDASKLNRPRDHHRNVSWGDGLGLNFLSEAEQSQGQHAPVRTEENSLDSYPTITSKDHPTHRNHRPTKSFISLGDATAFSLLSSSPHPRRVVLDDVLKCNPLETEAEALIMRVLEEQENANRDRANTESSPTPANVPEDANIFGDCKEQSSLDYNMEEGSSDDSEIQPFLDDKGADNDKIRGKPGHRRHARRSHERQNTLESHLMDLTEVLNELHGVTSVSDQDHKTLPVDSSSGATLAENANKIFRQNVKADRDGGHTPNIINDIEEGKPDTPRHSQQNGRKFAFGADSENNGGLDLSHVDEGNDEEETSSHQENQSHTGQPALKPYRRRLSAIIHASVDRGPIIDFVTFLSARSKLMRYYTWAYASVVAPLIGIAFILFYLAGNPTTGILTYNVTSIFDPTTNTTTLMNTEGEKFEARTASASWWLLFIVRQLTLFTLANLIQLIVIDFFCLSTRVAADYFGQLVTLFIAQSKGWPFVVFFWGILGFSFLAGKTPWADHWAYWQDVFGLFNYQNPSGSVPSSELYIRILSIAIAVTLVVAIKRLWLGLVLGRKTFRFYAEDLAKVMKKTILLRKVARVNFSGRHSRGKRHSLINPDQYSHLVRFQTKEDYDNNESDNLDDSTKASNKSENNYDDCSDGLIIRNSMGSNGHRVLSHAEKTRLNELLGFWEEPEKEFGIEDSISINAISQFRQSLQFVEDRFMFGIPFGDVSSRENMVINAQKLFQRLNRLDDKEVNSVEISFDVLALAAVDDYGDLDEVMLKDLIRLLRPDRNGKLKLLEFVKSIDGVYKEAKLLRAAVNSCEKIDKAFENVIDVVFYVIALCIILNQLGLNPLALFLSLSSFILAFAFMIGSASSRMFEGWLMVLLQRPYDIGDRIHVSNVQSDSNLEGSFGWIVKDVTLYTTTVVFQPNNERATISNGSMASSRIINAARSPKAVVFINLKFSTSVPYERLKVFEEALRKFIRNRPREWASFITFRVLRIHVEQGFIEYITILQHREAWQEIFTIQESRSEVAAFCHELSKKMGMHYKSPPLPVSLAIVKSDPSIMGGHTEMPMGEDSLYSEIVSANALFDRMHNNDTT